MTDIQDACKDFICFTCMDPGSCLSCVHFRGGLFVFIELRLVVYIYIYIYIYTYAELSVTWRPWLSVVPLSRDETLWRIFTSEQIFIWKAWSVLSGLFSISSYTGSQPMRRRDICNVLSHWLRPSLVTDKRRFQGAVSIRKTVLPGMAIPMLKIRRPNGRLIFNMEITIRR